MKRLLALFAFLSLVLVTCAQAEKNDFAQNETAQAPDFSLLDLKGNRISLSAYRGKVLFLNFWATWCPPCRAEIADFVEVYKEYKNKGMEIIGLSVDEMNEEDLLAFVEKYEMNYSVAFATEKIVGDYEPGQYIPTTIIIDKQGKIRHKHVGLMRKESLIQYFQKLSREK